MTLNQPFDAFDAPIPEFGERISVSRVGIQQVEAIIKRQENYRDYIKHILGSLNSIAAVHYKALKYPELMELKHPMQNFVYSRESLENLIEVYEKDITAYRKHLQQLQEKYKEKQNGKL